MKKLFIALMTALLPFGLSAQNDAKAAEILDRVLTELSTTNGIRLEFGGTETGFLLLKGEKFYLNNGNIQSWFDGKNQWSYVADTEEVNISHPSHEELQSFNPYFILKNYNNEYTYQYKGNLMRNGVKGHEIVLVPKQTKGQEVIRFFISKSNQPQALRFENNGQTISEINVTSYQGNQQLKDEIFRFNRSLYPNVEIIDMR